MNILYILKLLIMNYITKDVENWITGVGYSKFKKDKKHNELEYKENIVNIVKYLLETLSYDIKNTEFIINNENYSLNLDIETDDVIWKIVSVGWYDKEDIKEDIFNIPMLYSDIPNISGKKLNILSIAAQEEASDRLGLFDDSYNSDNYMNRKNIINIFKSMNIHFVRGSTLLNQYLENK